MAGSRESGRWLELAVLIVILIVATVLRTWRLNSVPPGLTHDEAGHGHDSISILDGNRPIYETVGYGREPLYDYVVAGLMAVLGRTREVLRFSAVPLGLMTLFATYAWTRLAYDNTVALASLALQSVSFWSLSTGRQALRSSLLPVLFTTAITFYWRSVYGPDGADLDDRSHRLSYWRLGVTALLIGAALYTYVPARVLWVLFPIFLIYLALVRRTTFKRVALPTLVAVSLGLLLAVPLFVYLRQNPGAEQRLAMLDEPLQALLRGDILPVLNRAGRSLAGFFIPGQGDDFLAYAIPGRPIFGPLLGILFVMGIGLCVVRWRQPASAFSLAWFLVGISPSLVTGPAAFTTRSIAALPIVFLFPALAAVAGTRWVRERWGSRAAWIVGLALTSVLLVSGISSVADYFVTWGESPHTRAAYQHTLVETAQYLDARQEGGVVGISTAQPSAPHDPYVLDLSLGRRDLSFHWFDARRAFVFPSEPNARLIVPASTPPSDVFADLPGLTLQEQIDLRPDDLDPSFSVYEWSPRVSLAALRRETEGSVVSRSPETVAVTSLGTEDVSPPDVELPVNFGNALELLGYDLRTPTVAPAGTVELVTLWQVTDPQVFRSEDPSSLDTEPVLFTHALDEAGTLIAQEDRLDAPAWDWQKYDVVAQIHRFTLPRELSQALVPLEVGIYRRADLSRLPVLVDEAVIGDCVFLEPVKVEGQ
ncbi:MAG: hypothetical protein PVJ55_12555 [Anaerolineae bacterium]|jgi:hypothetical protein